jgi:hypothetical protein
MIEAAGEAATQHSVRYFVGRDTRDGGGAPGSPAAADAEHKDGGLALYEDIEMDGVSGLHSHLHSGEGADPEMKSTEGLRPAPSETDCSSDAHAQARAI